MGLCCILWPSFVSPALYAAIEVRLGPLINLRILWIGEYAVLRFEGQYFFYCGYN